MYHQIHGNELLLITPVNFLIHAFTVCVSGREVIVLPEFGCEEGHIYWYSSLIIKMFFYLSGSCLMIRNITGNTDFTT